MGLKCRTCQITGFPSNGFGHSWPPPLTGVPCEITIFAQRLHVGFKLRGEERPMASRFLQLPAIPPGQNTGTGRRAFCIWCIGIHKKDPFTCNPVKSRCIDPTSTVSAHMWKRSIIGNTKENIWRGLRFWWLTGD